MTPDVSPYISSIIAVVGTLLGGLMAGIFTLLQMHRTISWQKQDAERRYLLESDRWAHTQSVRWDERRMLAYAEYGNSVKKVISLTHRVIADKGYEINVEPIPRQEGLAKIATAEL